MKNNKNKFITVVSKIDRRHLQIALLILTLSLFVLSAGAPGSWGDFKVIIPPGVH